MTAVLTVTLFLGTGSVRRCAEPGNTSTSRVAHSPWSDDNPQRSDRSLSIGENDAAVYDRSQRLKPPATITSHCLSTHTQCTYTGLANYRHSARRPQITATPPSRLRVQLDSAPARVDRPSVVSMWFKTGCTTALFGGYNLFVQRLVSACTVASNIREKINHRRKPAQGIFVLIFIYNAQ